VKARRASAHLGLPKSTASVIVKGLSRRGLVRRRRDTADERHLSITLTKGRRRIDAGPRATCALLHFIRVDLLDFRLRSVRIASKTSFGCWISVGFRGGVNTRSHEEDRRKQGLTRSFASWAVAGSNRRLLRCKRGAAQSRYLRERPFFLVTPAFRGVVTCPGVAWYCAGLRNKSGTRQARRSCERLSIAAWRRGETYGRSRR
jgi:hypothetical protein